MSIDIFQYGGYTGSYAGDCSVIGADETYVMIDLGRNLGVTSTRPAGEQAKKGLSQVKMARELDVIITHFHADHVNDGNYWPQLKSCKATVHYGEAVESSPKVVQDQMEGMLGGAAIKYEPIHNGKLILVRQINNWKLEAFLIVPDLKGMSNLTDNDASLGVLIELSNLDGGQVNILTIGDMTPRAGNDAVAKVLEAQGYGSNKKITSVKLSHHGSEKNFLPVLDNVITTDTTVLISGYTLTAVGTLTAKLNEWSPKQTFMLFDPAGYQDFKTNFPDGSALLKKLTDAGVRFLTDFHVPLK